MPPPKGRSTRAVRHVTSSDQGIMTSNVVRAIVTDMITSLGPVLVIALMVAGMPLVFFVVPIFGVMTTMLLMMTVFMMMAPVLVMMLAVKAQVMALVA